MKKTFLLLTLLLIFLGFVSAQPSNEKKIFPTPSSMLASEGQYLIQTADGGYLLTGTGSNESVGSYAIPRLIKLGSDLQVSWDKNYLEPALPNGITAVVHSPAYQTADGGYALAVANDSTTTDFLRLDAGGNILWVKDYGWSHSTRLLGVLPDGGFVLSFNSIIRLDANGEVVPMAHPIADASAILLSNNDILTNYNNANGKRIFQRTDLDGNVIWQTQPIAGLYPIAPAAAMPDGGFAIIAVNANGLQEQVHRFNSLGNEISVSSADAIPSNLLVSNLAVTSDSRFLLSGQTTTNRGFIAQMNAGGDGLEWSAESPEDGQEHLKNLNAIPTTDGWAAGVGASTVGKFGFLKVGVNSGISINILNGRVTKDNDENCVVESSESGLYHAYVVASNGLETFGTFTDFNGNYQMVLPAGDYTLSVTANEPFFFLCPMAPVDVSFLVGANGTVFRDLPMQSLDLIHEISGIAQLDQNDNCIADAGEPVLSNWPVEIHAASGDLHLKTDANGLYKTFVPDGTYGVALYPFNNNFSVCTPATQTVSLTGPTPQVATLNFVAQAQFLCARMRTELGSAAMRPCSTTVIHAYYRNDGTTPAYAASMRVTLDPLLSYTGASQTPDVIDGQSLTFNLGDLSPTPGSDWQDIQIYVDVDCALTIGDQVCASSMVFPDQDCTQNSNWSGAIVSTSGNCDNGLAIFKIQNIGSATNSISLDYIITEDQIVLRQQTFQLGSGEFIFDTIPSNGGALTIVADQEPGYPGDTSVVWNIFNCGGMGAGMGSGFGGPAGPFTHQECFQVTTSYDPNDKDAIPAGFGPSHLVHPGTPLEYRIRFQNTGNDTAFLVVIRDTLSEHFNFGKIEPRGASHHYEFAQINDSIVQFTFKNILLPDSTTNVEGSQGFVEFGIYPKDGLADGTEVMNSAAIYFDHNPPVITNTVQRIYGKYVFVQTREIAGQISLPVQVYPNPFVTETTFEIPENSKPGQYQLRLLDESGRILRSLPFEGNKCTLQRQNLPTGVFAWSIVAEGKVLAGGTVVAQ